MVNSFFLQKSCFLHVSRCSRLQWLRGNRETFPWTVPGMTLHRQTTWLSLHWRSYLKKQNSVLILFRHCPYSWPCPSIRISGYAWALSIHQPPAFPGIRQSWIQTWSLPGQCATAAGSWRFFRLWQPACPLRPTACRSLCHESALRKERYIFILFVCRCPMKCHSMSLGRLSHLAVISCTLLSPNTRWPARYASSIASLGWNLETATSRTPSGSSLSILFYVFCNTHRIYDNLWNEIFRFLYFRLVIRFCAVRIYIHDGGFRYRCNLVVGHCAFHTLIQLLYRITQVGCLHQYLSRRFFSAPLFSSNVMKPAAFEPTVGSFLFAWKQFAVVGTFKCPIPWILLK